MSDEVHGFEEKGDESPWCVQCNHFLKWPSHDECIGCLRQPGKPAEAVTFRTVHWDVAVLHAVIRRKVAVWEQRHPGWELVPDMQRYWEDSTHPSRYVDRETGMGRKLAWTRLRVERTHPRGVRHMRQVVTHPGCVLSGPQGLALVEREVSEGQGRWLWTPYLYGGASLRTESDPASPVPESAEKAASAEVVGRENPWWGYTLTMRPGSSLVQAVRDGGSVQRRLVEVLGLTRRHGGEASPFDRDLVLRGGNCMAEPDEREVESPRPPPPPPEPEDVPEPAPPAPGEDEEAEETPA